MSKENVTDLKLRKPKRFCANPDCEEILPDDAPKNKQYHDEACATRHRRAVKERRSESKQKGQRKKDIEKYIRDENADDLAKEVIREEVKGAVGPLIRQNVAESMVGLTGLLPQVVENLREGLESRSFIERRHAEALILKYAIDFATKDAAQDSGVRIVIEGNSPPTRVESEEAAITIEDGEIVEEWEKDMKKCRRCNERFPDENLYSDGDGRYVCTTCNAQRLLERDSTQLNDNLFRDTGLYGKISTSPDDYPSMRDEPDSDS